MATTKPHVFELNVYERGAHTKTLRNDSGKVAFGVIDDLAYFAGVQNEIDALGEDQALEVFAPIKERLEPMLVSLFANYEPGDIDYIDMSEVFRFIEDYTLFVTERFEGISKNRQGVAPRTKR